MQRLLPIFLLGFGLLLAACGESSAPSEAASETSAATSEPADSADGATTSAPEGDTQALEQPADAPEQAAVDGNFERFGENVEFNACEPEVIEVFAYTCPHCYDFEEYLTPWIEGAEARGVSVERRAMPGGQAMTTWASVYAALKLMGQAEDVHHAMFDRLHGEGQEPIRSLDDLLAFVESEGIDPDAFQEMLESEQVREVLEADFALMQAAGVRATPTLLVNKRYKLEPRGGQGFENMLATAEQLIARDRQAANCADPAA